MSALNLNDVKLCGRLTADVELKATPSGTSVCTFTLAINRPRPKDGGEQTSDFIKCVAWGKTAEFITRYFGKGESLFVRDGTIQTRNYKDKDGKMVYYTEVLVRDVQFVDYKNDEPAKASEIAPEIAAKRAADKAAHPFGRLKCLDGDMPAFEEVVDEGLPF